ncbi:unnamed protein product [Microthlaspi erraticum]|uniref:Arabidopsis retrotransposon Orf1 C-terminal domain-containing protein n=1 Tax=Microthlaspi erraticum TaxID=1685480 RepID=A0A6D2JCI7_9BRAS|nr:unnamed protein product [Microthlaspi erraticum]
MEEEESSEEEDELPMYQEHYDALFSMDFVETKYPHDDTMKALGIFEMWSWSSRTCTWPSSSLPHGVYKELTCEFLASMRYHSMSSIELIWTKDWDGSRSWQGREGMVTFRQLEILFGFTMGGNQGNIKEDDSKGFGLQSLMELLFLKVQGSSDQEPSVEICAQGTCQHLLCKEGDGTINEEK